MFHPSWWLSEGNKGHYSYILRYPDVYQFQKIFCISAMYFILFHDPFSSFRSYISLCFCFSFSAISSPEAAVCVFIMLTTSAALASCQQGAPPFPPQHFVVLVLVHVRRDDSSALKFCVWEAGCNILPCKRDQKLQQISCYYLCSKGGDMMLFLVAIEVFL